MSVHMIGMTTGEGRGRFAKQYTDAEFYRLPFIREYGCVPPGFFAWHLEETENVETSERVRMIAELPYVVLETGGRVEHADAELVLLNYERERLKVEAGASEEDEAETVAAVS